MTGMIKRHPMVIINCVVIPVVCLFFVPCVLYFTFDAVLRFDYLLGLGFGIGIVLQSIGSLGYFLTSEKRLISIFNFRKNANVKGIYNFARDPPMVAETLIMFFSKSKTVDDHIGDLEELFRRNLNRFGVKRARRLYWAETFRSIRPMVWPALKRLLVATAAVSGFKKWLGL